MWPPQRVNTCPTPACRSVRATRCPPLRSATLAAGSTREVHHLELHPVGILEEDRVVARTVLRELARRLVERREPVCPHELVAEAIHLFPPLHPEGHVIEARPLAVEPAAGVGRRRRPRPHVRPATPPARH